MHSIRPRYPQFKLERSTRANLHQDRLQARDSLANRIRNLQELLFAKGHNLNRPKDRHHKLLQGILARRVRCARCKMDSLKMWSGKALQTCPQREPTLSKTSLTAKPDSEETDNKGRGAWASRYRSFNCTVESGLNCECEWCNTRYVLCVWLKFDR